MNFCFAGFVNCGTADKVFVQVDVKLIQFGTPLEKSDCFRHHFGPDTVAG